MIESKKTLNGFRLGEFEDVCGNKCSLQQSSAIRGDRFKFRLDDLGNIVVEFKDKDEDEEEYAFSHPGSSMIWLGRDKSDAKILSNGELIDYKSKHRRLKRTPNRWVDKRTIHQAFDDLFAHFRESILVVSYRSDGIPSQAELVHLVKKYKSDIRIAHYGQYQYALSKNDTSEEILLICTSQENAS